MEGMILVVSDTEDAFEVKPGPHSRMMPLKYFTYLPTPFAIKRVTDGAMGYIVNTSPDTLHITYSLVNTLQQIGPRDDYLLPMQAKEIGAAPHTTFWHVQIA